MLERLEGTAPRRVNYSRLLRLAYSQGLTISKDGDFSFSEQPVPVFDLKPVRVNKQPSADFNTSRVTLHNPTHYLCS